MNMTLDKSRTDRNESSQPDSQQGGQDSQYKNVETSVNNKDYFNDDYEVKQEDDMMTEEAKREQEDQQGNNRQRK